MGAARGTPALPLQQPSHPVTRRHVQPLQSLRHSLPKAPRVPLLPSTSATPAPTRRLLALTVVPTAGLSTQPDSQVLRKQPGSCCSSSQPLA